MRLAIALAASLIVFSAPARSHSLDASLLLDTICKYESRSSNDPEDEISKRGAVGYCQVRIGTARFFGYKGKNSDLMGNRELNKKYGMKLILMCLRRWHSTPYRIAFCYHAGPYARVPRSKAKRSRLLSHKYAVEVAQNYRAAVVRRNMARKKGQGWRGWTLTE